MLMIPTSLILPFSYLQVNPRLTCISASHGTCDDAGIAALFDAICTNQTVRELALLDVAAVAQLGGNKVPISLGQLLRANVTLETFSFSMSTPLVQGACIVALAEALCENNTLRILNIESSDLSILASATALGNALRVNSALQELYLYGSSLGDDGACALAEGLRLNSMLRKLDIRNNEIEERGATALADSLRTNACLQEIELRGNRIGDDGAVAFAAMLGVNASLRKLNLWYNRVGAVGTVAIASALRANTTLLCLTLRGNDVTRAGMQALMDAMRHNITLLTIHVPFGGGTINFPENRLSTPEELLLGFVTEPELVQVDFREEELPAPAPAPASCCLLL
jgi:Ran GTPase-activating protein (RanGAP) involved in mRNA processing and transport